MTAFGFLRKRLDRMSAALYLDWNANWPCLQDGMAPCGQSVDRESNP